MVWKPSEKVIRWRELAGKWARQTGVPTPLILAVIQQESGGNLAAVRFEGGYLDKYGGTVKFRNICKATGYEPEAVASSYGLMQLMMPLAWGYMSAEQKNNLAIDYLLDPDQNIRYGAAHLAALIKGRTIDGARVRAAAGAYNGGGSDSAYARNVYALWQRYDKFLRGVPN